MPNKSEQIHFENAIRDLLSIGAISECEPHEEQFLSSIFLRPKPNGKFRLILNLKNLNKFIETDHFKIEDLRTAIKLLTKNCYMCTLDLKDAYFLLKIHNESKKYLRFQWAGKIFEFNVLPFGLNTAPYVFTKIMKPVAKLLRLCGYLSTVYLDDQLLLGRSYSECVDNINTTKKLLSALGFKINFDKSVLIPSTTCKFLGYIINSHSMTINLPTDKRIKITKEIQEFTRLQRCTIRRFARLLGLLISACPAVEYGLLYTKDLERCKYLNLKADDDYEKLMNLPSSLLPDLRWWLQALENPSHRVMNDSYAVEIYSDASTTGWGAACEGQTASGQWSQDERRQHINVLELLAAFFALKIFARDYSNCQILLRIDNSTAIAYINRMGGIQYPHLTRISRNIWQWCESKKIFIFACYIKSADNQIADAESRRSHPDIEWELSGSAYKAIVDRFGQPTIDLFASRLNKKCDRYVSWHRDPDAFSVNAFTIRWSSHFFYAFPPFAIILKTLRKIILDKATGIIVVPDWPTQPWYPVFRKLLISDCVTFPPSNRALISHSSRNIQRNLTLVAGILSGQHYCNERFRNLL